MTTIIDLIIKELKVLNKKDSIWTKDVENKIKDLIDRNPKLVEKKGKQIVWDVYEDLKMKQSIDKVNYIHKMNKDKSDYVSKTSKIGRISRRKALFDMTWVVKQNAYRLNQKELMRFIAKCEKDLIYPEDYDVLQTAKIRDEYVYFMDGKLYFHTLEKGKETKKSIKLSEDSVIVLGKGYVFRINNENREIEDDRVKALGLKPLDSIFYTKGNMVFVLRN